MWPPKGPHALLPAESCSDNHYPTLAPSSWPLPLSLASDLKLLYHIALRPIRGKSHADRMENFYAGQAKGYDDFRKRLLKGREELHQQISWPEGGVWVDLGGGTSSNLEYLGDRITQLAKVYVVDLSPSLLAMARERMKDRGWEHAEAVEADATTFQPAEGSADVVTFSYSLTMIPDWFAAIDNALAMLKPGGILGVVDFYVSRKHPGEEGRKHGYFTRQFWRSWFDGDNVFPSPDHLPYLSRHLETLHLSEHRGSVPYLPLMRVPYYVFVGRKAGQAQTDE